MKKEIICTVCPRGCRITVEGEGEKILSVEGYGCKRGVTYATAEFTNPVRILTTTVLTNDGELLPVRSAKPVPKNKLFECMEVIRAARVSLPVKMHDIIISNICNTGVDIVATKAVK